MPWRCGRPRKWKRANGTRWPDEHGFIVVYPSGTGVLPKMWRMKPEADLIRAVL
jgi:hypothetical protein